MIRREEQRLMLAGSALAGLLAQTTYTESGWQAPVFGTIGDMEHAARYAVTVADHTLAALAARESVPGQLEATTDKLLSCWTYLDTVARAGHLDYANLKQAARTLLQRQGAPGWVEDKPS